jgi:hypothetical protein
MVINKLIFILFLIGLFSLYGCNEPINDTTTKDTKTDDTLTCETDSDCVPSSCCHPDSCVNKANQPDCQDIMCSLNCKVDSLDCGQGSCQCINNKCGAVFNE